MPSSDTVADSRSASVARSRTAICGYSLSMRVISLRSISSTWLATVAVAVAGRLVSMNSAISPISEPASQVATTFLPVAVADRQFERAARHDVARHRLRALAEQHLPGEQVEAHRAEREQAQLLGRQFAEQRHALQEGDIAVEAHPSSAGRPRRPHHGTSL